MTPNRRVKRSRKKIHATRPMLNSVTSIRSPSMSLPGAGVVMFVIGLAIAIVLLLVLSISTAEMEISAPSKADLNPAARHNI